MKNINARANERTVEYLASHFKTKGAGAEYILAAWPVAARKFICLDMKGKFSDKELGLMIDVMNGKTLSPELAGQQLPLNVADGIALDGLDEKWGVAADRLNDKLASMSTPELMILEIWIQGSWQAVTDSDQDLNEYIKVAL